MILKDVDLMCLLNCFGSKLAEMFKKLYDQIFGMQKHTFAPPSLIVRVQLPHLLHCSGAYGLKPRLWNTGILGMKLGKQASYWPVIGQSLRPQTRFSKAYKQSRDEVQNSSFLSDK